MHSTRGPLHAGPGTPSHEPFTQAHRDVLHDPFLGDINIHQRCSQLQSRLQQPSTFPSTTNHPFFSAYVTTSYHSPLCDLPFHLRSPLLHYAAGKDQCHFRKFSLAQALHHPRTRQANERYGNPVFFWMMMTSAAPCPIVTKDLSSYPSTQVCTPLHRGEANNIFCGRGLPKATATTVDTKRILTAPPLLKKSVKKSGSKPATKHRIAHPRCVCLNVDLPKTSRAG